MQRRPFLKLAGLSALLGLAEGCAPSIVEPPPKQVEPQDPSNKKAEPPALPKAWSFVLLPDTQYYSVYYPNVFMSQTQWIAANRAARNIQFVLHLGDLTETNAHPEWINARRAMDVLRDAAIPHLMVVGNHDYRGAGAALDRGSHFSEYFSQKNSRVLGESENAFMTVTVGSAKLLIVGLEFGPRDAVVDWANAVVAAHPDHHAILLTHAYTYSDSTRYDWSSKARTQAWNPYAYAIANQANSGVNDGEQLWQKLVSRHPQFVFTFNGHVLNGGIGHLQSEGAAGRTVHQMLVNYQRGVQPDRRNGGGGFLRLVEVETDGRTVNMSDYSPFYDEWLTEPQRKFTITLDQSLNAAPGA